MTIDPRKRQKQLQKKAAKRKAAHAARKDAPLARIGSAARQIDFVRGLPIHECLVPEGLFAIGIGNVIVSRRLPNGDIGASFFLVDVYCLGVKDAFFQVMSETEYMLKLAKIGQHERFEQIEPSCARKLVEDAEAYAGQIGFDPHPDYRLAGKIFGNIDAAMCPTEFSFGKDGKPFFVSGPRDTPAKCKRIMDTLMSRFGPDGFHFMIGGPTGTMDEGLL